MTFLQLAEKILREEQRPFTPEEIWLLAQQKGYAAQVGSQGKTPHRTIGAQLYVDIRDNPDSPFFKASVRPTRFSLKELASDEAVEPSKNKELIIPSPSYKERDLHKLLSYYLFNYKSVYSKTIYHEESNKKQYSQWLHPDMVGVYFPLEDWQSEVFDIAKEVGNLSVKLYSFELKKELNFNNLRESFFQAVSNSSWAHEGYLVTARVLQDEEFFQEIKRLSNAFGIGIIKLDTRDPDSSEILLPAKEKEFVDIETMNKIAEINPAFREFLKRIKIDLSSKEIRREMYDEIFSIEELKELFATNQ